MPSDSAALIQTAKKIASNLQTLDKRARKQTLIDFQNFLSDLENEFGPEDLLKVFMETHMYFLNGLRDSTELVREQAIKFSCFLIIDTLPINDFYLTYVLPVLVERIGREEIIEESEEIRLDLVKFLQAIISKYANTDQLKPFLGDCVLILCQSVKDKHPAIKELSCRCVIELANALPRDFHLQAESLIKPLISCLGHQRFRVRVEAIRAIGEVVMHSSYKGLDPAVGALAEKLFDQIPLVRRTVSQVSARWLLGYRDRYSFFHRILPLILTGLNDEVEETRNEAYQLWEKVGLQYLKENEKELKDQIDFLQDGPEFYPPDLVRPNLGCRVLVQKNIYKIAKALGEELTGIQEDIRFRCSQLLCSLAHQAEENIVHNLEDLLPAMCWAARDESNKIVDNIIRACELMGWFIPVQSWYRIVLPTLELAVHKGILTVLYGFIKGTPKERFSNLEESTNVLSSDLVCFTRQKYQNRIVEIVEVICEKITDQTHPDVGYHLFKILLAMISLKDSQNTNITNERLSHLAQALDLSESEMWSRFLPSVLEEINQDPKSWLITTPQRCIFETILLEAKSAFGENLSIICEILCETLNPEADAEARLKTFWALSGAFDNKSVVFEKSKGLDKFFAKLIWGVFVPNLIWHPGLTAEAMRTMVASCLLCALTPKDGVVLFCEENLRELFEKLLPLLISLLEDAAYRSRQLAIENLVMLKRHCCSLGVWSNEDFLKIYPEILKRLDDPIEKVRVSALENLPELFKNVPESFKENHFKAHHELIIDTLLTHFDDDDENVKRNVFDILKVVADINHDEVMAKVQRHKPLLCNQEGCEKIISYLNESAS